MIFPLFKNIATVIPEGTIDMEDVIAALGSEALRKAVSAVRTARDPEERDQLKRQLPNVCFNANLTHRGENIAPGSDGILGCRHVLDYNQVTALDFDNIPGDEMAPMRNLLVGDPYACLVYTTPSGHGLKMLVRHDNTNPLLHAALYEQMLVHFSAYPHLDHRTRDLARASYLSYDPAVYCNRASLVFHFDESHATMDVHTAVAPASPTAVTPVFRHHPMTPEMVMINSLAQSTWKDKALMDYIERYQWSFHPEDYEVGNRNNSLLCKAAQLYACGVHYDNALWKLIFLFGRHSPTPLGESEIRSRVSYAYTHGLVPFGSKRGYWEALKKQRVANYRRQHNIHL